MCLSAKVQARSSFASTPCRLQSEIGEDDEVAAVGTPEWVGMWCLVPAPIAEGGGERFDFSPLIRRGQECATVGGALLAMD